MLQKLFLPKFILHLEGAIFLLFCTWVYAMQSGNWLLFALVFFVADVSIAAYLINTHAGAISYNIAHSFPLPAILGAYGLLSANPLAISLALIWFAHIGFDR